MYIECQECNTTFRLDESLLNPAGSKVRCSQCGNIFVALPPSAVEPAPITPETATPTAAPSEPDPSLDQTPEAVSQTTDDAELGLKDVDLAELDSLFGQDEESPAENAASASEPQEVEIAAELDEPDYEIDFEAALESDDSAELAPPQDLTEDADSSMDDMDLELDFDLDDDAIAEVETPEFDENPAESDQDLQAVSEEGDDASDNEFELALDDVDLDDGGDATVFADMQSLGPESDDDLDIDIDQDATIFAPAEEPGGEEEISELDIDLDIDLEMEDESGPASNKSEATPADGSEAEDDIALNEDFFSDLDSILDDAKLEAPSDAEPMEDVELELDGDSGEPAIPEPDSADEDLEELSFELDAEYEDKPIAQTNEDELSLQTDDDADEIDLSEIELMLEGDTNLEDDSNKTDEEVGEKTSSGDDFDLGLDDEIDLAELTAAIDSADFDSANDTATIAEDELELALASDDDLDDVGDIDLDIELESSEPILSAEISEDKGIDDELDLSDFDNLEMEEPTFERDTDDTGDIELEFQIEDEDASPKVQEQLDTITPSTAPPIDQTIKMPEPSEEPKPTDTPKPKKKTGKLLLVIFILILLGAIGFGIYYADTEMGIKIPYVTDYISYIKNYLSPESKDPAGTAKLSTLEINSKFINNESSGRLFVITGQVHNGYSHGRGQIHLQGKLFTKGKALAQTEWSYAGQMLNDQVLATTPFAEIKKQLATPPQTGTPGTRVQPNQNLAFMVVFSNLPAADELEEFAVEVVKSLQMQ